jgi:hypothetical protein
MTETPKPATNPAKPNESENNEEFMKKCSRYVSWLGFLGFAGLIPGKWGLFGLFGLLGLVALFPPCESGLKKKKSLALKDLDDFTDRISVQVRAISITLLTLSMVGLLKPSNLLDNVLFLQQPECKTILKFIGCFSFLALIPDYFHYLAGAILTRLEIAKVSGDETTKEIPNYISAPEFRVMRFWFYLKQMVLLLAAGGFAWLCVRYVLFAG